MGSTPENNIIDHQILADLVMDEYNAGRLQQAIDLLNRHDESFPEQQPLFCQWRACFLSLLGRADEAIDALQVGIDRGFWWPVDALKEDPDLIALQGRPEFEAIVTTCIERYQAAKHNGKPERIVLEPEGLAPDQPRPLILALHGRNGNVRANQEHWERATRLGWQVVLVGSSQVITASGFGWDDREIALLELRQHLDEICRQYPIDDSRIVLGGFSQGGWLAMVLTLTGALPVCGCIAAAPSGRNLDDLDLLVKDDQPGQRRYVLFAGELDQPWIEGTYKLIDFFERQGLDFRAKIYPDIRHAFPADFADRLPEWLDFLTSSAER